MFYKRTSSRKWRLYKERLVDRALQFTKEVVVNKLIIYI